MRRASPVSISRWIVRFSGRAPKTGSYPARTRCSFAASESRIVGAFYAWQERLAAKVTHRILSVSGELTAKYLRSGIGVPSQYQTVYSGLDVTRYADDGQSSAKPIPAGGNVVLAEFPVRRGSAQAGPRTG